MDFGLISLPVLAVTALFGYAVLFDTSAVVFHDVKVPAALEELGYSPKVMASRLANDVRLIDQQARTVKDLREFALPDDEAAVNALGDYFQIGEPIKAAQEFLGLIQYNFTGDVVQIGDDLKLSVRGVAHRRNQSFNATVVGRDPEKLTQDMALEIVRFIDPYVVASYVFETARDRGGDYTAATREVRHCLVHLSKTDLHWAYNLYGLILAQQGKYDEAMERYASALALQPDFVLTVYNIGNLYLEKKQYDQAIAQYQEVLKNDSLLLRTPHAYTQWGVALVRQGQPEAALPLFDKAIEVNPMYADAYYQLGLVYKQQGKIKDARDMIQRAADRAPGRKDIAAELAPLLIN